MRTRQNARNRSWKKHFINFIERIRNIAFNRNTRMLTSVSVCCFHPSCLILFQDCKPHQNQNVDITQFHAFSDWFHHGLLWLCHSMLRVFTFSFLLIVFRGVFLNIFLFVFRPFHKFNILMLSQCTHTHRHAHTCDTFRWIRNSERKIIP